VCLVDTRGSENALSRVRAPARSSSRVALRKPVEHSSWKAVELTRHTGSERGSPGRSSPHRSGDTPPHAPSGLARGRQVVQRERTARHPGESPIAACAPSSPPPSSRPRTGSPLPAPAPPLDALIEAHPTCRAAGAAVGWRPPPPWG
jgi:hypothetical protein